MIKPMKLRMCVSALLLASVAGCVVAPPSGPSIAAYPREGQNFDQFNANDASCRQFASTRSGTPSEQQQQNNQVGTAVAGTALGAVAGALVGSATGHVGTGAAVGAGLGLLGGSAVAANQAQGGAYSTQHYYDVAYAQCMIAKGERVPGYGGGYGGGYDQGPPSAPPPGY